MAIPGQLAKLSAHLRSLQDSPDTDRLDISLVEQSSFLVRISGLHPSDVVELAHQTLALLRTRQDDLDPLVRLLSGAIELVAFDDLQTSIPVDMVTEGLSSPSPSIQDLGISYLKKAAESPSGAASVANGDALVRALITLFLTSKSADIGGTKALGVILALLSVDNPDTVTTLSTEGHTGQATGQGLLWRRIFNDEEIYNLFFYFTSSDNPAHGLSKSEITTAQGRLLDFVLGVARIRWDAVCGSRKTDLQRYSKVRATGNSEDSFLQYAALNMVDQTDPLMKRILISFLTKLLELKSPLGCSEIASIPGTSSPSLEFLIASGLHQSTMDYYLRSEDFDPFEVKFLVGAYVQYLCTYVDLYPKHFFLNSDLVRNTVDRLNQNLQISGARWAHGQSPYHDLDVLAHLPALALLSASQCGQNPLLLLPTNPANPDVLEALGTIFQGPRPEEFGNDVGSVAEPDPFSRTARAAAARILFYQYHERHPEFWSNVGAAMNVLAMPLAATAAIRLVKKILTGCWAPLLENITESSEPAPPLTEQRLRELCGGNVSSTGVAEVLNAGESVIHSLLTPMKTGGGDAEAARLAWRLWREKFDVLQLISCLMEKGIGKNEVASQVWQSIRGRIHDRIWLDGEAAFTTQTNLVSTMGR